MRLIGSVLTAAAFSLPSAFAQDAHAPLPPASRLDAVPLQSSLGPAQPGDRIVQLILATEASAAAHRHGRRSPAGPLRIVDGTAFVGDVSPQFAEDGSVWLQPVPFNVVERDDLTLRFGGLTVRAQYDFSF